MASPIGGPGLYHPAAYDIGTPPATLWRETAGAAPMMAGLTGDVRCAVAIIGGGITGLSAALHLARDHGVAPIVLDAAPLGWGASGRNGGFCVPGGSAHDTAGLARRFGPAEAARFSHLTRDAVARVAALLNEEAIDADAVPGGEMLFAHSAAAARRLRALSAAVETAGGHGPVMLSPDDLRARGLHADSFHGALWEPAGFGLHPLKYTYGVAAAVMRHGGKIADGAAVLEWSRDKGLHVLRTAAGVVRCEKVVVATGAYQPERLARALAGSILPVQSNILVTRPLSLAEQASQGWSSTVPASDSYRLLHYFRLLPDGRFLFGGRGGLSAAPDRARAFRRRLTRDFHRLFPAWRGVEITHFWSGLVDLAADLVPHCAVISADGSVLQACAYHGSGVAMGTELGAQLASLAMTGRTPGLPDFMQRPPPRFPFAKARKIFLAAALSAYAAGDAIRR